MSAVQTLGAQAVDESVALVFNAGNAAWREGDVHPSSTPIPDFSAISAPCLNKIKHLRRLS
jgi:hypothetical protein